MNRKDLYQSFNIIDDDILERSEQNEKKRSSAWIKGGVLVACLCLAFVGVHIIQKMWKVQETNFSSRRVKSPKFFAENPSTSFSSSSSVK